MKTINIMGTCCSRFIFNFPPMNETFKIRRYAFQTSLWNCFDNSLNLNIDDIEKIDIAPFTRRMANYDFNNFTLQDMEQFPSDYLMLDLMSIALPLYKINNNGLTSYTQNIALGSVVLPKMMSMPEFEGLTFEKMNIEDLPEEVIKEKLDLFCQWAINNYPVDHIIICKPRRPDQYILASDNELYNFDDKDIEKNRQCDEIVEKYTDYLKTKLDNAIYYEFEENVIAYDANCKDRKPAPFHYTDDTYRHHGEKILTLISSCEINDSEKKNLNETKPSKIKFDIIKWSIFFFLFLRLVYIAISMIKKL